MKNKKTYIILASLISLLLACFPFSVCADETTPNISADSPSSIPYLDSYFYENYDLLPYIQSNGQQYINTSVKASNNLKVDLTFSDLASNNTWQSILSAELADQGSSVDVRYGLLYNKTNNKNYFRYFYGQSTNNTADYIPYNLIKFQIDKNIFTLNGSSVSFNDSSFTEGDIYIFSNSSGNDRSAFKLYKLSIYDYSLNDNIGGYVRYYYPAKSKSGNVIGLYDAVSKTFVTTSGSVPFENPTDDKVLHFQIGDFVTNGLEWIGQILDFAIAEPMILMFMAIGLCGVAIRWARRVVHF